LVFIKILQGDYLNEIKRKNKKERKRYVMPDDQAKLFALLESQRPVDQEADDDD